MIQGHQELINQTASPNQFSFSLLSAIYCLLCSLLCAVTLEKVQNLNRTLGDLEEGTKSRNRTFQKQIVCDRIEGKITFDLQCLVFDRKALFLHILNMTPYMPFMKIDFISFSTLILTNPL